MKEPTKKLNSNLTYKKHAAMDELAKKKDLIITNVYLPINSFFNYSPFITPLVDNTKLDCFPIQ